MSPHVLLLPCLLCLSHRDGRGCRVYLEVPNAESMPEDAFTLVAPPCWCRVRVPRV